MIILSDSNRNKDTDNSLAGSARIVSVVLTVILDHPTRLLLHDLCDCICTYLMTKGVLKQGSMHDLLGKEMLRYSVNHVEALEPSQYG